MKNSVRSVTFAALLLVVSVALLNGQSFFNQFPKCKTTLPTQRITELCYKEVTGKDPAQLTGSIDALPEKEREDTLHCALKKNGIIGLDGKTVNIRKSDNAIDSMEAEPDIKNKLKSEVQLCADKGGEGIDFVRCNIELINKICRA